MHVGRVARSTAPLFAALALTFSGSVAGAQDHDHGAPAAQPHKPTPQESVLIQAVRDATAQFANVTNVAGPGGDYKLQFGCVSGGDFGAMGIHYVSKPFVEDGEIKVDEPEIILFEPTPGGGIRITGVDYLVDAAQWDANHDGPPQLMGQLFHLFDKPNRFGLDPFYTLHVWAWKDNPNGTFANWNPNVSCDAFSPGVQ